MFLDAFCAKSFSLTEQEALVHHPCKLVGLCLAAAKSITVMCTVSPSHTMHHNTLEGYNSTFWSVHWLSFLEGNELNNINLLSVSLV